MSACQEPSFSLEGLFFDSPERQTTELGKQGTKGWSLAPPPCISDIPATQDLQKEAEQCRLRDECKKTKRFMPPFKKTDGAVMLVPSQGLRYGYADNPNESNLNADIKQRSALHVPSSFHSIVSDNKINAISDFQQIFQPTCGEISFHNVLASPSTENKGTTITSVFQKSLFRPHNASLLIDLAGTTRSPINDGEPMSSMQGEEAYQHPGSKHFIYDDVYSEKEQLVQESPSFSTPSRPFYMQATDDALGVVHDLNPGNPLSSRRTSCVTSGSEKERGILRPVTELPTRFRSIFKEFPYFNYIQSKALDDLLYTDKHFVICAPTGSGKTVIFELAVTRLLMEVQMPWSNVKIVYMAPIKALCSQRFEDWKGKFGPIGVNCKELTGDTQMDDLFEIQHAHIIMTTPEKWDSMTRKWRDNTLVQLVRLFLIDEVHVVKDESRGATLEVVVSRMKTMQSSLSYSLGNPQEVIPMRFVAVSATIPNAEDIAEWLSEGRSPVVCLKMDESHRPVKLRKVVLGFPWSSTQTEFKFDLSLNYKIASIIQTYSERKPTLVFCATRKGVQQAASVLAKDAKFIMDLEHKQRLQKAALSLKDSKLKELVLFGVGYHHAGIDLSDRKIIEGTFNIGDLPVLFTTSTLAMGVNLPAHLVVIKSTMHYAGGMFQEYSETDILQMIGRAGRPQFDTTATAVIMTRLSTKEKYLQMLNGADTIESSLHRHLIEHLNAEIVLRTITDACVALKWIQSTFLYIRSLKNPAHYGFPAGLDKNGIEAKLQELCLKNLHDLSSVGLIAMDEEINFKPTDTGRLMALYYIAFDTVKQFCRINGSETLPELVTLISSCSEFSDIQLRTSEKKMLNSMNKDKNRMTIRYPIEGKVKTRDMKVNCLIQAQLGCIPVQDFTLTQDTAKIFRNGTRVAKCLSEFLASEEKKFSAYLNSLILAKCFKAKLWESSLHVSKQLEKIGVTLSNAMVNASLTTFQKIEDTNPRELELILNRHPPFGNLIREAVIHLPKYELIIEQISRYHATVAEIVVSVMLKNYELLQVKRTAPNTHHTTLVIGDSDNQLLFKQKILDSALLKTGSWTRKLEIKRPKKSEELSVNLISSDYVGLDIIQKFTAFYVGQRTYGTHMDLQNKSQNKGPNESFKGARPKASKTGCNREEANISGKGECNHHCKNKDACGHDCCKRSAPQSLEVNGDSAFSSYLSDLRTRNAVSSAPPVKRLKMQILKETQTMDQKGFDRSTTSMFPALSRFGYQQKPLLTSLEQPKFVGVLNSSPQQVQLEHFNFSAFKHPVASMQKSNQKVSSDKQFFRSLVTNLTDADKNRSRPSESFNVTFDLGEEVWEDFEEETLLKASSISSATNFMTPSGSNRNGSCRTAEYKLSSLKRENKLQSKMAASFPQLQTESNDNLTSVNPRSNVKTVEDVGNPSMFKILEGTRLQPPKEPTNVIFAPCFKKSSPVFPPIRKDFSDSAYHSDDETAAFLGIFDGIF